MMWFGVMYAPVLSHSTFCFHICKPTYQLAASRSDGSLFPLLPCFAALFFLLLCKQIISFQHMELIPCMGSCKDPRPLQKSYICFMYQVHFFNENFQNCPVDVFLNVLYVSYFCQVVTELLINEGAYLKM